jgi:hypothetical protein
MVVTEAEERLFRALIENAADESLNPADEWEQEMAKWFFYTDEYDFIHEWLYDCPGDGYREKMEHLWETCKGDPEMARKLRMELRKIGVNQERNARLHYGPAPPPTDEWRLHNAQMNALREKDKDTGRYK